MGPNVNHAPRSLPQMTQAVAQRTDAMFTLTSAVTEARVLHVTRPNSGYESRCLAIFTGPTCGNVGPLLGLLCGIVGLFLLLYLTVRVVKYFKRVRQDERTIRERNACIGDFIEGGRISERELTYYRSLGEGAFGEVKLAEYREMHVAVKILHQGPNRPIMGSDTSQLFEQEIEDNASREHRLILRMGRDRGRRSLSGYRIHETRLLN